MNRTVVTALPYFEQKGEEIAATLNARFVPYTRTTFSDHFREAESIIAIMAIGIVIRSVAPFVQDKWKDPAVVVISPDFRYVIPVLGGHHGGNDLAYQLSEKFGFEPVITTATEATGREAVEVIALREKLRIVNTESTRKCNAAVLTDHAGIYRIEGPGMVLAGSGVSFLVAEGPYSVGIGCRLGTGPDEITSALSAAFTEAAVRPEDVAIYASVTLKSHESGLIEAVRRMNGNIIFLSPEKFDIKGEYSQSAANRFGIPGVAEPAALAVSVHHQLIMEKKVYGNVTIAIAR